MNKLVERIMEKVEPEDFYSEFFDKVDGKSNLPCPFPDKHKAGKDALPSFRVFLDTGGAFCHGCGYKCTNFVNFWSDVKGIPFDKAVKRLYSKYVEPLVPDLVWKSAHEKLMGNGLMLSKIEELRGLTKDTVQKYRLGYDGRRLTIPIFDINGWCVNLRRYDLFKDSGAKMVSYKEGFGAARLYPLESLKSKVVIVVEGELDALIGCQAGLPCISPAGGSKTWKDEWSRLLKDKSVAIVPDNDKPGKEGAEIRRKSITAHSSSCVVVELPVKKEGEDLTDWFLRYEGTAKALRKMIVSRSGDQPEATSARQLGTAFDVLDGLEGGGKSKSEQIVVERSETMWQDLVSCGGFFRNAANELFYAREGLPAMKVTSGFGPFMSFLSSRSSLVNQATSTGKFIYNHILNKAYSQSELSKTGTWSMFDGGRLFIHAGKDRLLKFGEHGPTFIKNAINDDRVLLDLPVESMAISEKPSTSPAEGLKLLKGLFMDNLAMQEEDRYLLVCWLSAIFFRDYVRPKPIVRLLAKTASGKSTSSKLVSVLLYGEELLSHSASTLAATYEMSVRFPLVLMDNLETRNMTPNLEDFLLVAATGGMKAKRQMSTDSGLIMQQTNSLVLTNGIEPFSRHELIDRTMEIDLDLEKYGSAGFQEARVFHQLKASRQQIFASILFLLYKYVMPRIRKGEIARIMKEFSRHGKERFNEYLALMCLVLDAFWGYLPSQAYKRPHDMVNFWLDSQTHAEQRQDEGTNEVLYFLSTFVDRYTQLIGAQVKVDSDGERRTLKCTTRELLSDFRVLSKYLGMKCPWQNERQLGTRIADSEEILNRSGWTRRPYVSSGRAHYEYAYLPKDRRHVPDRRDG